MRKPIFLQYTIQYGVIIYLAAALVAVPTGICSSSYQTPAFEYPLFSLQSEAVCSAPDPDSDAQVAEEDLPQIDAADAMPFHNHIWRASQAYEVDMALIRAIIMAESSNNPRAVSHRGAQGLMQLMPTTAKSLGVEDAFNPALNIDGGVRYFRQLLDRFNGNIKLALAAYNAGSRYVRKYGGVPPFKATRIYIQKVLKYRNIYQQEMVSNLDDLTIGSPSML